MRHISRQLFLAVLISGWAVPAVFSADESSGGGQPAPFATSTAATALDGAPATTSASAPKLVQAAGALASPAADDGTEARPQTRLPQADNDGSLHQLSVSERMNAMRRRAVDANISRPFLGTEPASDAQQATPGALPAVRRRPLTASAAESQGDAASLDASARRPAALPEVSSQNRSSDTHPLPASDAGVPPTRADAASAALGAGGTQQLPTRPLPQKASAFSVGQGPTAMASPHEGEQLLLTNQAPALAFETAGPRTIVIGKESVYRVTMVNLGGGDARGVVCTVGLPAWAEITGNAATVGTARRELDPDGNHLMQWQIDALPSRSRETLTLQVVPRDGRPFDLTVGWAIAPDKNMAHIEVQEPKLELALTGAQEVEYGETNVYSITLSNPGTGDAENVVLNLMPMTANQQIAGTRNLGTIAAGQRKTMELELTAHQAGQLQVKALAYADNNLRAEVTQDVLVRRANLQVVVMGPPRNFAATVVSYKVRLENTGNAAAGDAAAVASLPAGARFVGCSDGGRFDEQRGQVQWQIGTLRPGAARVLELQCELHHPGENRLDIQCQSAQDLSVTKSITTLVEALADLKLYVNDPPGAVAVGQETTYEVKIVNRGTKAAEHVQLVGYFSEGVEPEAIEAARGEISTGQVVFEPIPAIAPGQELVFRIVARGQQSGNHVFRAELLCDAPETRLAAEEWTKYYDR